MYRATSKRDSSDVKETLRVRNIFWTKKSDAKSVSVPENCLCSTGKHILVCVNSPCLGRDGTIGTVKTLREITNVSYANLSEEAFRKTLVDIFTVELMKVF